MKAKDKKRMKFLEDELERARQELKGGRTRATWKWRTYIKELESEYIDLKLVGLFGGKK